MLITHGHFDHVGDCVTISKETGAPVVANYEIAAWLEHQGVTHLIGMNMGGTVDVSGIKVTMVPASHSSSIMDADAGRMVYAGSPCGYIIELENGYRIYDAGDTSVFADMKIIGEYWRPDLAPSAHRRPVHHEPRVGSLCGETFGGQTGDPDAPQHL